jgi:hypothetical protein
LDAFTTDFFGETPVPDDTFFFVAFEEFVFTFLFFVFFDFSFLVVPRAVEPFEALEALFFLIAIQVLLSVVDVILITVGALDHDTKPIFIVAGVDLPPYAYHIYPIK